MNNTILTAEAFRIPACGLYSFEGKNFNVSERLSGYGSGKKTVYTFEFAGVVYDKKDITFLKRVICGGAAPVIRRRSSSTPVAAAQPAAVAAAPVAPVAAEPAEPVSSEPAVAAAVVPAKFAGLDKMSLANIINYCGISSEPEPAVAVAAAPVVPVSAEPVPAAAVDEIRHACFDYIFNAVKIGIAPFMYGPAGTGKNVIAEQVARALGLPFYSSSAVTQEYKIAGFVDAGGVYRDTQFYKAYTTGGVFLLDEIDASTPEVLVCLNSALANGYFDSPAGRVVMHPDCRIIAAGNTTGRGGSEEYTRALLDGATLNRFAFFRIDYDSRIESKLAAGDVALLDFVHDLRKTCKNIGYNIILSYRNITQLLKLAAFMPLPLAVNAAITKGAENDILNNIIMNWTGSSDNKYMGALCEYSRSLE